MRRLTRFLVAATFMLTLYVVSVAACDPAYPRICQAFERADAVFIGKLIKVEALQGGDGEFTASFEVRKSYKGVTGKVETAVFGSSDCDPKVDAIGQEYFVYREPSCPPCVLRVGNRTRAFFADMEDMKFAETLDPKKQTFHISGSVSRLPKEILSKTVVTITIGKTSRTIRLDHKSLFDFAVRKHGIYKVTILFPRVVKNIWMEQLKESQRPADGRTISYEVEFRPNGCDFREISADAP